MVKFSPKKKRINQICTKEKKNSKNFLDFFVSKSSEIWLEKKHS
jgi:hypothetical protein